MKKVLFLLFVLVGVALHAQNAQEIINGLKKDLKANPDDKKRATIYSDLTWYYSNISIDSSMYYGEKALFESKKINDSTLIAQVYSDLASVYFRKSDLKKSKENYLKAYAIRKIKNDEKGMAKIDANLGNIYQSQGSLKLAMTTYLRALDFFSKINDLRQVNVIKGGIGSLYYELKDYSKSLLYTNEVIQFFETNNLKESACKNYLTKGNILLAMKDTVASINAFNKSLVLCQSLGDNFTVSKANNNLAVIKQAQNQSDESKKLFKKVLKQRQEYNSDGGLIKTKLNEAYSLLKEKKYQEAKNILVAINTFFIKNKLEFELSESYKYLVPIYAKLEKPDSVIHYQSLYERSIEKATVLSVIKQTAELETKYQTAKKEKQIIEQQVEAKKRKTIILILSLSTLFIGLLGFLFYRQQKLKNKQQTQAFELKQAFNQIETQNKLQTQRLAISKDLYDNIGAQLTFIISSVETAKFAPEIENTKLGNKLTQISDFTKDTIVELRDTIWAMNSNEIGFNELRGRILNFIEKANQAAENVAFQFNIDTDLADLKLTSIVGMNIYRTIQEAINNALKYAKATQITVDIKKDNAKIKIEITDNGIGFDPNTIDAGNGLLNMQKRMEEIGGTFHIDSEAEKGTSISVQVEVNL